MNFRTSIIPGLTIVSVLATSFLSPGGQAAGLISSAGIETCTGLCFGGLFSGLKIGQITQQGLTGVANGQNIQFKVGPNGEIFFSSKNHNSVTGLENLPKRPETIEIALVDGVRATSEFTELEPGSGILIGARHSLQGQPKGTLANALQTNQKFSGLSYRIIGFKKGNAVVDALLLVPSVSEVSTDALAANVQAYLKNDFLSARVQVRDEFFSYQIANQTGSSFRQDSTGPVFKVSLNQDQLLLPALGENYTAPGSSGAIVFTRSQGSSSITDWKATGIVSCGVGPRGINREHLSFEAIRVLTLEALRSAQPYEVSEDTLSAESEITDPGCLPLDGRGGGG